MPDPEFAGQFAIQAMFPGLGGTTLRNWATSCPLLGRPVVTRPHPRTAKWREYSIADVTEALRRLRSPGGDAGFEGVRSIAARFPDVDACRLSRWAVFCRPLGRPLRTIPHPHTPKWRHFHVGDVRDAMATREAGPLPDEFDRMDGHWIWIERITGSHAPSGIGAPVHHPFHVGANSIARWRRDGCPALGGRRIDVVWRWSDVHPNGREYVRREDLERVRAFRAAGPPDSIDGWVDRRSAIARFDRNFLTRYSDSNASRRRRAGRAHPALGRLIRTNAVPFAASGKIFRQVWYSAADLATIENCSVGPGWVTRPDAVKEYSLSLIELTWAVRRRLVQAERFPVPFGRQGTKGGAQWYFSRSSLEKFVARRAAREAEGKPNPFTNGRRHIDATGRVYWRQTEACHLAGVKSTDLVKFRNRGLGCKYLAGGRPLSALHIDSVWKGSRPKVWVYLDDDLSEIWQRKHGAKGRRRSKPTGRRRGRERQHDADADAAFVARWKASGKTLAEFAAAEPVPLTSDEAEATHRRHRSNVANARRRERVK